MNIYIENPKVYQGVPFAIHIKNAELPKQLLVESKDQNTVGDFWVPVKVVGPNHGISEISLQFSGQYRASNLETKEYLEFEVRENSNLSFSTEMSFLGGLSLIIAGGILIWIIRMKKKKNQKV